VSDDSQESWEALLFEAPHQFAEACSDLRNISPLRAESLDQMMNTLMTELWDRCFSQTQIRTSFLNALSDMNRYAAGEEIRP
jgi:hypothetical protein